MGLKEFASYCDENYCDENHSRVSDSTRPREDRLALVQRVYTNPGIIGIRKPSFRWKEVRLRNGEGRGISQLDLVLTDEDGEVYLVICSSEKGLGKGTGGAPRRLIDAYRQIREEFNLSPILLYVRSRENGFGLSKEQITPPLKDLLT